MIETNNVYVGNLVDPANSPGVSWRAVFAGAAGSVALTLILILLGMALGFTAMAPWMGGGISGQILGISAIVWLTLTQIAASGMGGYLAGRLRARWVSANTSMTNSNMSSKEVFFRDSAHGFLAWALATLLTAMLVLGSVDNMLSSGMQAGGAVVSSIASGAPVATLNMVNGAGQGQGGAQGAENSLSYYVDMLFRTDQPPPITTSPADDQATRAEALRIFINSISADQQQLSRDDLEYLASVVAQRTGLSQGQAEQRVEEVFNRASQALQETWRALQNAAEQARQVAAWSSLWMFVALLCGVIAAGLMAVWGGKQRDRMIF